jgi:hypothetical protein
MCFSGLFCVVFFYITLNCEGNLYHSNTTTLLAGKLESRF